LNPRNASDASLITKNGYSNIEEYLNSVVDVKNVTATGTSIKTTTAKSNPTK